MSLSKNVDSEEVTLHRLEIQRGLGRVEGKLDQIIIGMSSHEDRDQFRFTEVHTRLDKLDSRQNRTERKIWVWSGAIAIVAFFISHFPFNLLIGK